MTAKKHTPASCASQPDSPQSCACRLEPEPDCPAKLEQHTGQPGTDAHPKTPTYYHREIF